MRGTMSRYYTCLGDFFTGDDKDLLEVLEFMCSSRQQNASLISLIPRFKDFASSSDFFLPNFQGLYSGAVCSYYEYATVVIGSLKFLNIDYIRGK
ncbi:hypothetical protein NPIL_235091 [Nephila pilipes]|uniref:Uncharacterized protein n=1 Tax=Nephila pilipes TaxID=299642 RepID=A0A8X6I486_NEPPI|nr:hypothetical protein NPIL_235091 [Nephila pilipes]